MPSGYSDTLPDDILLDTGVLSQKVGAAQEAFGVTRGGTTFTPELEIRNVDFDGKRADIVGLDRIIKRGGKITGTFIQIGATQIKAYEPGSTSATAAGATTITPKKASTPLVAADYLTDLTLTFLRANGGSAAVIFPKGLCTKYDIKSQDNSEAEVAAEFSARLDMAGVGATTDDAPYKIVVTDPPAP